MTKSEIREEILARRQEVKSEERRKAGHAVAAQVMTPPAALLMRAWRVCIYLSTRHEIPTRHIARAVWQAGREVCIPAWSRSAKRYKLYALHPDTRLVHGHFGIREPAVREPINFWEVDAFIVPGLAFDAQGGRLGFGAGYYDGMLAQARSNCLKIALCYDWQVRDEPLPQEPHDIKMDWVVTEKRILRCASL